MNRPNRRARSAPRVLLGAACLCVLTSAAAATLTAQIRLPRLPRGVPREIPRLDRLPSLDDLLGRQPLTSSLSDAVTEVPFLDRYDPTDAAPLLELPFGLDDGVTLVPGTWQGLIQSYCLKAGTYGPTRGDGYLWAPLKGPRADVIAAILNRSPRHADVHQHDIQVLLWGIIARTRVSQLPDGPRQAAQKLLTDSEVASLDGSALDVIPDDWLRRITGPIEGPVRRALEAENRLRQAFARPGAAAYEELEQIAVLRGVPAPSERGRDVPHGRWSYHPSGFFIRFLPNSYTNMELQLYVPERFAAARDDAGRLVSLRDPAGASLQIDYDRATHPIAAGSMAAHAVTRIAFTPAGGAARQVPASYVFTGEPAKVDAIRDWPEAQATAERARHAWSDAARLAGDAGNSLPRRLDVADVSHLAAALGDADPEATAFLARAWASAAADWIRGTNGSAAARRRVEAARYLSASARGVFVPPTESAGAAQSSVGGGWGGGGGGGGGGFGPGGGGGMPGGGRQRLGPSLRKFGDNSPADKARDAIDKFGKAKNALDLADPAGLFGFSIPDYLFGKILDFNFDKWGQASSALAGDPPRPDFREFTIPEAPKVPAIAPGPKLPRHLADRLNALMRDVSLLNAQLSSAIVALDRHGGAVQAQDRVWASRQAHALIHLKREAGRQMLAVAAHLDALAETVESAPRITPEQAAAMRERLQSGWSAQDREAAALVGLGDEDLNRIRAARLAVGLEDLEVLPRQAFEDAAAAMRDLGGHFASLPAVGAPW